MNRLLIAASWVAGFQSWSEIQDLVGPQRPVAEILQDAVPPRCPCDNPIIKRLIEYIIGFTELSVFFSLGKEGT
jgi:hypothetical protein